ncbi:uncharacterized protein LOC131694940 [Topomyia yanbarensis]|uniref:uncharacterized protein LOC131694940 n=1 Tax=Topomyia yanbarensis TaxID=2498891 RepID=UPI00273B8E45|nr:uncharacterized protein LOC131694940 [Topomyia yanbarensis]
MLPQTSECMSSSGRFDLGSCNCLNLDAACFPAIQPSHTFVSLIFPEVRLIPSTIPFLISFSKLVSLIWPSLLCHVSKLTFFPNNAKFVPSSADFSSRNRSRCNKPSTKIPEAITSSSNSKITSSSVKETLLPFFLTLLTERRFSSRPGVKRTLYNFNSFIVLLPTTLINRIFPTFVARKFWPAFAVEMVIGFFNSWTSSSSFSSLTIWSLAPESITNLTLLPRSALVIIAKLFLGSIFCCFLNLSFSFALNFFISGHLFLKCPVSLQPKHRVTSLFGLYFEDSATFFISPCFSSPASASINIRLISMIGLAHSSSFVSTIRAPLTCRYLSGMEISRA